MRFSKPLLIESVKIILRVLPRPLFYVCVANNMRLASTWIIVVLFHLAAPSCLADEAARARVHNFNIQEPHAPEALNLLARQSGSVLLYPYKKVRGKLVQPVVGVYPTLEALELLLKGSGLSGNINDKGVIHIKVDRDPNENSRSQRDMIDKKKFGVKSLISAIAAVLGVSELAAAQTGAVNAPSMEEVIVTAQRKEQNLQKAPVAISAFSADDLEQLSIASITDVGKNVPNAVFTEGTLGGGRNANYFIRGVGQADILVSSDPGVGIYIDDVYIGQGVGSSFELVDIERVEVLRGPQGTLYGKNTIGGLVHAITRTPSRDGGGTLAVTMGSRDLTQLDGSYDVAVGQNDGAATFTGTYRKQDGYGRRLIDGEKESDQDMFGGRIKYKTSLTDDLGLTLSVDGTRARERGGQLSLIAVNPAASVLSAWNALVAQPTYGMGFDQRFLPSNPYESYATGDNYNDLDNWGASAVVDAKMGESIDLKSVTAYRSVSYVFTRDADHSPLPYVMIIRDDELDQFSQEFQFGGLALEDRLDWIAGIYYFHSNAREDNTTEVAPGLYDAYFASTGIRVPGFELLNVQSDLKVVTDSYAVYGQSSYAFNDRLKLTLGMRYTEDEKDVEVDALAIETGRALMSGVKRSDSWSAFTPKVSLDFQATSDVMLYASAARGFKSGGFNGRAYTDNALLPYDPEYVLTYEVGIKTELFDNQLRANAAIYYSDYSDIQLTAITSSAGAFVSVTQNVAEATIQGAEFELLALLTDRLTFSLSVGILDDDISDVEAGTQGVTEDSELVQAPEFTGAAGVRYQMPLANGAQIIFHTDYTYRSNAFTDVANTPQIEQEGFGLLGAGLIYEPADARWSLGISGTNLTDEEYITSGVAAINGGVGFADAHFGRPREWKAAFKWKL